MPASRHFRRPPGRSGRSGLLGAGPPASRLALPGVCGPAPPFPSSELFLQPLVAFKMATLALAADHNWDAFSSGPGGFQFCGCLWGGRWDVYWEWGFPKWRCNDAMVPRAGTVLELGGLQRRQRTGLKVFSWAVCARLCCRILNRILPPSGV